MIGTGALSGGIGSVIGGGNFWDGFRNGLISSGLNHAMHMAGGPPKKNHVEQEQINDLTTSIAAVAEQTFTNMDDALRALGLDPNAATYARGFAKGVPYVMVAIDGYNFYLQIRSGNASAMNYVDTGFSIISLIPKYGLPIYATYKGGKAYYQLAKEIHGEIYQANYRFNNRVLSGNFNWMNWFWSGAHLF